MKGYVDGGIPDKFLGQSTCCAAAAAAVDNTCQRHGQSHDIASGNRRNWPRCARRPPEKPYYSLGEEEWSQDEESINCRCLHIRHDVECKVVKQFQIDWQPVDRLQGEMEKKSVRATTTESTDSHRT